MKDIRSQRSEVSGQKSGRGLTLGPLRFALRLVSALLFALCSSAAAQQSAKVPRIGIVSGAGNRNEPGSSIKIFRQALQELGYVEGKNILFEYRYTEGNRDRVPGIVAELVSLKVDVLFSTQAIVVRAAKQATKTIPIVMAITPDPVAAGLVDSLARPGGNITGLTFLTRELSGKRLELLTEIIPRLSRVGILTVAGFTAFKDYEDAARSSKGAASIPAKCKCQIRLAQGFPSRRKGACQRDYHN